MAKIDVNLWSPYARYGVGAASIESNWIMDDFSQIDEHLLSKLALDSLKHNLFNFLLFTQDKPEIASAFTFSYLDADLLAPGKESGQISQNGYYLAPHVITSSDSAKVVGEIKSFIELLKDEKVNLQKSYELKRSFVPMITKFNSGKSSMSNPYASILEASFCAVTTITLLKPCMYTVTPNGKDFANFGIIPDLPLQYKGTQPLIDFIQIFKTVSQTYESDDRYIAKIKDKTDQDAKVRLKKGSGKAKKGNEKPKNDYKRPKIFDGNYPGAAPNSGGNIGSISLLAAIGRWYREISPYQQHSEADWIIQILDLVGKRSLYIVSYEHIRQEFFGHHLVDLAFQHDLSGILKAVNQIELLDTSKPKFEHDDWKWLKRSFDIFLRFYSAESFRDFLAFRAIYPATLEPFFKHFFKQRIKMNNAEQPITDEIIESARIYGQSLNWAAHKAAFEEVVNSREGKRDQNKKIKLTEKEDEKLRELKHRKLMQLESMIMANQEDEPILDLLSRLGRMVARETLRDIDGAADVFIKATIKNEISSKDAKSLILIYMRLRRNFKTAPNQADSVLEYQEDDIEIEDETLTE